jgi:TRAP-type transport system periplasmic protein
MRKSVIAFGILFALESGAAWAGPVQIKVGTLAPEGSVWVKRLQVMAERWKKASEGTVELKIYPGGVAGDEGDMVRKMRIGQLHAAMITGIGLGSINRATIGLQVPMLIQSWEELDYIRERVGPEIAKEMESSGFVVLNWGDAGWVHFFSTKPAKTPDEYKKMKLFTYAGDASAEKAWRKSGFQPVPLSTTDVMSGLQTGMVESFQTTSLFALTSQWFTLAKNMLKVNWAPLNGATVISKKQWEKVDPKYREELLKIAAEEGAELRKEVRALSDNATQEMTKRGLQVAEPDAALVESWRKTAELAYPDIRGQVVPEKYFDEIQRLAKEFRSKK